MEDNAIIQSEITNATEKGRLAIIEKKIDILKKRIEVRKEKLNIDEIVIRRKVGLEEQKLIIDKISELRAILSDWTIDSERTLLASEPFLKPTIEGKQREIILNKIMELIRKF